MAINLPYNLREGQVAYAAKVMANFRALLGGVNQINVNGLGEGDVTTMLQLLYQAMVKADQQGNAEDIVFADGDTLEQKFAAGTLNASLLTGEGMFYFYIDPRDGHLYAITSEAMGEDDFAIDEDGHLIYTLSDPENNSAVNICDLGKVVGPAGPAGTGDMDKSVYDPNNAQKDMNMYPGYFTCGDLGWGDYFLTYDDTFDGDKTYYTESGGVYSTATVTPGDPVTANVYYERLPSTDCLITDSGWVSGAKMTDHISGTSGHAFMGPSINATVAEKTAWQEAAIIPIAQGSGSTLEGAANTSSWIRIRALGTVPTDSIDLILTFYM